MSDLIERLRKQELSNSLPDDELCSGAADRIEQLEAQVNSLQNKWANRELSQQDSDALMVENAKLQAVVDAANHLLWQNRVLRWMDETTLHAGGDQEAVYHLEKALEALQDKTCE